MIKINLLPRQPKKKTSYFALFVFAFLTITVFSMGLIYFQAYNEHKFKNKELTALKQEISSLEPLTRRVSVLQTEISNLKTKIFTEDIFFPRYSPTELLKEIAFKVPANVRLIRINLTADNQIAIEGETTEHRRVASFMDNLNASPILDNIVLGQSVASWQGDFQTTRFSINATLVWEGGFN